MEPRSYREKIATYLKTLCQQHGPQRLGLAAVIVLVAVITASALMLPALASAEGDATNGNQPAAEEQTPNAGEDTAPAEGAEPGQDGADDQSQALSATDASSGYITQPTELTYQSGDDPSDEHHFTVTATVGVDAKLPVGTTLKVQEIREDSDNQDEKASYADHRKGALARLQQDDDTISGFGSLRLFRVTFQDASGNEVHPAADVQVKVSYDKAVDVADVQDVKVLGFTSDDDLNDTSKVNVLDKDKVQAKVETDQDSQQSYMSEVTFTGGESKALAIGVAQRDQTLTAEDDSYKVTLSYDGTAKLPEGVTASVSTLADDSDQYNSAKDAVVAEKKSQDQGFDESTLGMAALDITLHDKDGNEVEPDANGKVGVRIEAKSLPQEANDASLEVQHVEDGADQATTVASDVKADGTSATAEFDVSGFSVFTITWTTDTAARFAQVKLHYVDENGNELSDPTDKPTDEMLAKAVNGVITLKDYAEKDNDTRMANYSYVEARLSNAKTGTVVTGFLGEETTHESNASQKNYSLKYTEADSVPLSKDDSSWKDIPADAITGSSNNSVDVYLIYSEHPHITVHYVNENREEIATYTVKYADTMTNETLVTTLSEGRITNNGTIYTRKGTRLGKASGTSIYSVRPVQNSSTEEYTLQYRTSDSSDWQDLPLVNRNADVYVVYEEEPSLTIHYVNENGTEIASSTRLYAEALSDNDTNISQDKTTWAKPIDSYNYKDAHLTSYTGTAVTDVKYTKYTMNQDAYKIQVKSGDNGSWKDIDTSDIYLVYDKTNYTAKLNVHYMDIGGEPIKDACGNSIIRYLDASDFTTQTDVSSSAQFAITIKGYTFSNSSLNQSNESQTPTGMTLIASNNAPKNGEAVERGAIVGGLFRNLSYSNEKLNLTGNSAGEAKPNTDGTYDIYILYVPRLTIHYIDSQGNELYPENITNKSIQWGNGVQNNSATLSGYYNGHGTPDYIYDALPNAKDKNEITSLQWGHGDNNKWQTTLTLKNSTSKSVDSLVKDVYMVYEKTVTVHHVDENGNQLLDNTKVGITSGTAMTPSSFAKSISGYVTDVAYFADPRTDTTAKSFSSVTYTKDGDTWTSSAKLSNGTEDQTNPDQVWVVYHAASVTDVNDGIRVHYVDEDGHTVAADKLISTTGWSANSSATSWGWNGVAFIRNGTVTDDYLPTNPALGQPKQVYLGSMDDQRQFTLNSGNRAVNFKYDTASGWETGIDSTAANSAPNTTKTYKGLIMDLTFVYPAKLDVTVHHIDENGNKIAEDTIKTVQTSDTALHLSDFQTTVTNYTASAVKYGSNSDDASFESIVFSKNEGKWQYKLDSNEAINITNNADVYVVYNKNDDQMQIIIHFTDDKGNKLADDYTITRAITKPTNDAGVTYSAWRSTTLSQWANSLTPSLLNSDQYKKASSNGNTFKGEYIGPTFNTDENRLINSTVNGNRQIQFYWNNDNHKWYTSHGNNDNEHYPLDDKAHVFEGFIDNIYWVFNKSNSDNNLTVHYMHVSLNDDGSINRDNDGNPQYELYQPGQLDGNYPTTITYEEVQEATKTYGGLDLTDADPATYAHSITITRNDKTETDSYYGSYLGTPKSSTDQLPDYALISSDGPHISKVRVQNGQYQFLSTTGVSNNQPFTQVQRNVWTYTTTAGRTFTLRKDDNGRLSIVDSDGGRNAFDLNMTSSDGTTNTYTGISGAEGTGVEFTVKEAGSEYRLTVQEWLQLPQHNIYQLYVNENSPLINVGDEIIYSGNLVARTTHLPENAKIVSYKWEKQVNGLAWEEVTRSRNGNDWNIANDLKDRSWLNLVADNGELSEDERRNSVSYRVTLTYSVNQQDGQTETKSVTSVPYDVSYWDQLQNGGFETPAMSSADGVNNQYSNADYKKDGGVWQTTGLGDNAVKSDTKGKDIEIVNTRNSDFRNSYGWKSGLNDGAKEGQQFAELNCENAGALYQDVVTHPNEYLNYWLSHRARGNDGNRNSNTYYDTMYLVIMPTRLAMTSAQDGGELKSQTDLEKFINNRAQGGYVTSSIKQEENQIVYQDTNSGILIVRITSDNSDWHSIVANNGYVATSTLTRFFFVAGTSDYSTSHNYSSGSEKGKPNKTVGNFLDNVGFSQKLETPSTPHYHMVVEKQFTGLSTSDVAKLASNTQGNNFQLKIDEYTKNEDNYIPREGTDKFDDSFYELDDGGKHVQSLNGTVLGFTVDNSNNFTLTATGVDPTNKSKKVDLFKVAGNSGVVYIDPVSGTVRMRWTLENNYFGGAENKSKYFQVTESNTDIDGYAHNSSNSTSVVDKYSNHMDFGSSSSTKTDYFTVNNQDTALVNYTNAYIDNSQDEPDQIRVQKTFSGVTPSVVDQLRGSTDQFSITVSKSSSGESPITLIGNEDRPVDGTYPAGVDRVKLDTKINDDGSSTYTWTIYGTQKDSWISGDKYYVKEANYEPTSNNPVTGITLNGTPFSVDGNGSSQGKNIWPTGDNEYQEVSVGQTNDIPKITAEGDAVKITNGDTHSIGSNTYLIIGQYGLGTSEAPKYLVWTQDTMSVNEKATIREIISAKFANNGTVDESSVGWRSGNNPGKMEIDAQEATNQTKGSMTYDSTSGDLSFTNSTSGNGAKWQSYYSMIYNESNISNNRDKITEIRIKNNYEPAVRVMKQDKNTSTPLEGAKFKLFKIEDSDQKYLKVGDDNSLTWNSVASGATELETNKEGLAEHKSGATALEVFSQLGAGTYYIEETKAPDGYNMPVIPVVAFTVSDQGIVSKAIDKSIDNKVNVDQSRLDSIDWNSPYYTIHISNEPGIALPGTGGPGTFIFTFLGLLLIFGGGILLYFRKNGWEVPFGKCWKKLSASRHTIVEVWQDREW